MAGKSKTTASPDVGNSIYNSPYRVLAWEWLRNGMPVAAVKEALEEKGMSVTLPVIYNFRDIMQDLEAILPDHLSTVILREDQSLCHLLKMSLRA